MSQETQEQINDRLTKGVANNASGIAKLVSKFSVADFVGVVSALPASGKNGDWCLATGNSHAYMYDNGSWKDIGTPFNVASSDIALRHQKTLTGAKGTFEGTASFAGQAYSFADGVNPIDPAEMMCVNGWQYNQGISRFLIRVSANLVGANADTIAEFQNADDGTKRILAESIVPMSNTRNLGASDRKWGKVFANDVQIGSIESLVAKIANLESRIAALEA